jgi:hypothetical protein
MESIMYFAGVIVSLFTIIALLLFITKLPIIISNQQENNKLLKEVVEELKRSK